MSAEADQLVENVPEDFICPVSQCLMQDPYVDTDGNSYEKMCILDWLSIKGISPITRNPMTVDSVFPNRALKSMIERWKEDTGITQYKRTATESKLAEPSLSPLEELGRKPVVLFALIDNSGSMCSQCGNNASGENDGYNRLDLVKHTLNTIITTLTEQDKICIIKFNTVAEIVVPVTALTADNKARLIEAVATLQPEGMTNIWDALRLAVDQASKWTDDAYNIDIYLLTDGESTINPPGDIVETLEDFISSKDFAHVPNISSFGYGYDLDSTLLYKLSQVSGGAFGFIPDSTMVGTVFINALSNTLIRSAAGEAAEVSPEKDLIVLRTVDMLSEILETKTMDALTDFITYAEHRLTELTPEAASSPSTGECVQFLQDILLDCKESSDANIGQLHKALKPDFFAKWGKHYILSVLSAFKRRACINFKDKGMQHFKSNHFITEQKRVERVFVSLPPPKPSAGVAPGATRGSVRARGGTRDDSPPTARAVSMASYYNASGGCFSASSLVYTVDEGKQTVTTVPIRELRAGMTVMTNIGPSAVECLVELRYTGAVYAVGECVKLTAYHPVLLPAAADAQFPCELPQSPRSSAETVDGYVYDVVLSNRGIIACPFQGHSGDSTLKETVGDIINPLNVMFAATFGHCCVMDKFNHQYFGSEAVVDDLKTHPHYKDGHIVLSKYRYLRYDIDNLPPRDGAGCGAQHESTLINQVYKMEFETTEILV
jgi:uncharacterized protein YegL